MTWRINGFIDDKWVKYYSNPNKALRDYICITVIGTAIEMLLIFYIIPFMILHGKLKTSFSIVVYSILLTVFIVWELNEWIFGKYYRYTRQPIKIKLNFSDKGLEIINLFGKYEVIKWADIIKIEYSEGEKIYVATIIPRPRPPPIIAPRKIKIGLDTNIGKKVAEYWAKKYPERAGDM